MDIFVGNLAYTATEAEVRQLFEGYGTVDTVRLMTDRDTGRPRGFGFVTMPDATEAQAAIAGLNGTSLGDRTLTINAARGRDEGRGPRRDERGGPRRGPRW
jgi:cold-inducible RNA-binding protein